MAFRGPLLCAPEWEKGRRRRDKLIWGGRGGITLRWGRSSSAQTRKERTLLLSLPCFRVFLQKPDAKERRWPPGLQKNHALSGKTPFPQKKEGDSRCPAKERTGPRGKGNPTLFFFPEERKRGGGHTPPGLGLDDYDESVPLGKIPHTGPKNQRFSEGGKRGEGQPPSCSRKEPGPPILIGAGGGGRAVGLPCFVGRNFSPNLG